jgi:hypothetical protein
MPAAAVRAQYKAPIMLIIYDTAVLVGRLVYHPTANTREILLGASNALRGSV